MKTKLKPKKAVSQQLTKAISSFTFQKRTQISSQHTLDTVPDKEDQINKILRINDEEIIAQIKKVQEVIADYSNHLLKKKYPVQQDFKGIDCKIQQTNQQIYLLHQEIQRLKQIYSRPKQKAPNPYTQLHIKSFTLAQQIRKQSDHLNLHIQQHKKLKQRAKDLNYSIKGLLPKYLELEQKRGLKPISYGDFRKKAILDKQQRQINQKRRSISQRSSSARQRRNSSRSVKEIIYGNNSQIDSKVGFCMWQMQRRKSIIIKSSNASKKKHAQQVVELTGKLDYLRGQDAELQQKVKQLTEQVFLLESNINKFTLKLSIVTNNNKCKQSKDTQ